jgi:hypothetical protein
MSAAFYKEKLIKMTEVVREIVTEKISRVSVFQDIDIVGDLNFSNTGAIAGTLGVETPNISTPGGIVAFFVGQDAFFQGNVSIAGDLSSAGGIVLQGAIEVGSASDRAEDIFSADGNTIQAYVEDLCGASSVKAGRFDLLQSVGDGGTPISPQALRSQLTISSGTLSVAEGYGTFSVATQQNGNAQVVSNLIGSLGFARCLQTTPALAPAQWVAGTQSIVGGASAGSGDLSGSAIVCGSLSHVLYDPPLDGVAHGYVASRNGSGAGGTGGSAYKVVIGGGIDDWQYGVDLDTGSATNNYSVADIRLSQSNHIHTGSGAPAFATAPGSMYLRIDGANAGEVLYVNHDGQAGSWSALT